MTAVTRSLPCFDIGSVLPWDAIDWANRANKEIKELWNLANTSLTTIAGTNTITAQCTIGGVLTALTAYQDGQEFSFIPANTTTGAVTINIDSLGNNNVLDADGNALTSTTNMIGGRLYTIRRVSGSFRVKNLTVLTLSPYAFPRGMMTFNGFQISNDAGSTTDWIAVTAGDCRDSTNVQNIVFAGMTAKKMSVPWAAGSTAGSLLQSANLGGTITVAASGTTVTGSGTSFTTDFTVGEAIQTAGSQVRRITVISSNIAMTVESAWSSSESGVTYKRGGKARNSKVRVFCLRKDADGSGDIATAMTDVPNDLPAGYSTYRRIGYILTDATPNNRQFRQDGDVFTLLTPVQDISASRTINQNTTTTFTENSAAPPGTFTKYELFYTTIVFPANATSVSYSIKESNITSGQGRRSLYVEIITDSGSNTQTVPEPRLAIADVWTSDTNTDYNQSQFISEFVVASGVSTGAGNIVTGRLIGWRDPRP